MLCQPGGGATGGAQGEPLLKQDTRGGQHVVRLVHILDREEHTAVARQRVARAHLRLEEGTREIAVPAHNLAR